MILYSFAYDPMCMPIILWSYAYDATMFKEKATAEQKAADKEKVATVAVIKADKKASGIPDVIKTGGDSNANSDSSAFLTGSESSYEGDDDSDEDDDESVSVNITMILLCL